MRILMLNNEFPPLGGGTGTVNEELLKEFAKDPGLEIDLITSALGAKEELSVLSPKINIYKVPVRNKCIHHSSNRELLTFAYLGYRKAAALQRERPYDMVFAWSAVPAGGVALALQRKFGIKYLVRTCGPDIPGFETRYSYLYPILKPMLRSVFKNASAVVAKCRSEADLIIATAPLANPIIISNGVDTARYKAAHKERPETSRYRDLLCVGRLIERKGHAQLLQAIKLLVDGGTRVRARFVGSGDSERDLKKLSAKLGLDQFVTFDGYVPREKLPEVYQQAGVFVLPSEREAMSVAVLEAMATGLPVVTTRGCICDDVIVEGKNALVYEWGDIAALAHKLKTLLDSVELRIRLGIQSCTLANRLSWNRVAEQYVALLSGIVKK